MRSFVFYGQGGAATSLGMRSLADSLAPLGEVSLHKWYENVAAAVNACSGLVALFGFSLGANQLGWLGPQFTRQVDLGVALDPSKQSPLCKVDRQGVRYQEAVNFKKLVCFYNPNAWVFGGSTYKGSNVEVITINTMHLAVPSSSYIREIVLRYANAIVDQAVKV